MSAPEDHPVKSPDLTDEDWETLQELCNAVIELPGVWDRVESFMIGRGDEAARQSFEALRAKAFA